MLRTLHTDPTASLTPSLYLATVCEWHAPGGLPRGSGRQRRGRKGRRSGQHPHRSSRLGGALLLLRRRQSRS